MFCLKLFDTQKEVYEKLWEACRIVHINAFDIHLDTKGNCLKL